MASVVISPNMNLPVPVPGVDTGPDYANNLYACLGAAGGGIDGHNHTSGNGVPIPPGGLNINTDLPFNANNATLLRSVKFSPQSSPIALTADVGCIYVSGVDLYFNDVSGNHVRITQSGGVAGSPGSISNLTSPASANYVSGNQTFVWQSAANTAANMDAGSIVLRNITASSNGVTINPPNALSGNYSLTLPSALPASKKIATIDNSGNIGVTYDVDNVTLDVSGSLLEVKDGGITPEKMGLINYQISSPTVNPTYTNTTFTAIAEWSATITTFGNPVAISFVPSYTGSENSFIQVNAVSTNTEYTARLRFKNNGTIYSFMSIGYANTSGSTANPAAVAYAPAMLNQIDMSVAGSPGTYIYTVEVLVISGSSINIPAVKMIAYEL